MARQKKLPKALLKRISWLVVADLIDAAIGSGMQLDGPDEVIVGVKDLTEDESDAIIAILREIESGARLRASKPMKQEW